MRDQAERVAATARRTVLVVEHETVVADRLQSSLDRLGYAVLSIVRSAREALATLETHSPDLILIDVRQGEHSDCIDAAAEIRARSSIPVVLLAARFDGPTLMRAHAHAKPHGYVLTPYRDDELRAAVEVAIHRVALEQEVAQQRLLLAGVLGGMSDAVVATDLGGKVVLINEAGRRTFGHASVPAPSPESGVHRVYRPDGKTPLPDDELPRSRALTGESVHNAEVFVRSAEDPDGRLYLVNAAPLLDANGLVCGAVEVSRDSTELWAERSLLQEQSDTDLLTGAYNRRGFMQLAPSALDVASATGRNAAVFFVDLNGMKRVNDSLGHAEGDRLLVDVTSILRECFEASDLVGRFGGDEFVVLALDGQARADELLERLRATVEQFNAASERAYRISLSVGFSVQEPDSSVSLETLVEQADQRMYEDKAVRTSRRSGGAASVSLGHAPRPALPPLRKSLFPPPSRAATMPPPPAALEDEAKRASGERHAGLGARFQRAMDGLWMAFQPIVSLRGDSVFGYEALLRTDEPSLASPADFLEAAQLLGSTHELGRAIRAKVAEAAGFAPVGMRLFANVHAGELDDFDLYSSICPLSAFADRVVLEITERNSLDSVAGLSSRLARLRLLGFHVAVDDLGAGYASLSSFTTLEPDFVKLDISLVRGVDSSRRSQTIIRSMVTLCESLEMQMICEGVETVAERDALAALGCDLLQGYLFARPAPASSVFSAMRAGD